jgi:hypothetical protein
MAGSQTKLAPVVIGSVGHRRSEKKMTDRTAAVKSGIGAGGTDEPDGFAPLRALACPGSIRTFIGEISVSC